ncbi:adenosine deaminase [Rhodoluna lacicola]|jgi:adenosine deaminase|uniref:adenosine deaminase n=1 Tax=Rhodoluna lacicola TaxID=529884 RepID=UPI00222FDABD|nr:adenosine deaminase [Rhodoluna lacicola]BDS50844.1 adenosine deaminase 1 [Rhodoluna lacicola]
MANFDIRSLPKISLHDHLDGGLRPQSIVEMASEIGLELPADNAKDLRKWFEKSADSGSLVEYLKTFDVTTAVMQTREHLTRVAREFVLDLANDGVIYGEIRWAPEQHLTRGLTLDETVEAVQDGLEEGMELVEQQGGYIRTGQLVTAMRHADRGLEIAELAVRHRNNGVVGFDIAGAEQGFLPSRHKVAFDYLASELFPVTVHAGEADGIESIKDAIVSGRALRLGHGVRIVEDIMFSRTDGETDLVVLGPVAEWVHDRGIVLETSPSSNLQTGAISLLGETMADHPFDILYDLGFKVTVNTDNRLMSGTSLTREMELLVDTFGYGLEDLEIFQINAAEGAFQAIDDREELIEMISEGFNEAGR